MGKIRLNQMLFYGYHGADESEQSRGGTFEVDLEIDTHIRDAAESDHLEDTINYADVYSTVHDSLTSKKHYLLESLAQEVADAIMKKFPINAVKVNVRKPHAPVKGVIGSVEVEIVRNRSND
ncbi:MAG: dihydroneopterin aldolase [Fidelibacterota bacterium]